MITRAEAISLYGSAIKLAEALGYTSRHAVYMWPKSGPIPQGPYLRLRYELRPDAFDKDGRILPSKDETHASASATEQVA